MPLTQTNALIAAYGANLRNGILDDGLIELERKEFLLTKSNYNPESPVSESNYNSDDLIYDFVHTLAPLSWDLGQLHHLNSQMRSNQSPVLSSGLTLAKAFLAYEMLHDPVNATSHFDAAPMKKLFSRPDKMLNFRSIDLPYFIRRFRMIAAYPDLPRSIGERRVILDDLRTQINQKSQPIAATSEQLIAIIQRDEGNSRQSYTYQNLILSKTLSLLEGQISAENYRSIKLTNLVETFLIQSSYKLMLGGLALIAPASTVADEELSVLINQLAGLVAAEQQLELPQSNHLEGEALASASAAEPPSDNFGDSGNIVFFTPSVPKTSKPTESDDEYHIVEPARIDSPSSVEPPKVATAGIIEPPKVDPASCRIS